MRGWIIGSALLCGVSVLALGAADQVNAQGQQAMVIQGGTLVDGNGGTPLANSVIVIQGNRITAVGRAGQVEIPAGAKTIDAKGKWITPGLIDGMAAGFWMYNEPLLRWGVTSVMINTVRRDTGIAERDAINHGIYAGPRYYQQIFGANGATLKTEEDARAMVRLLVESGADIIGTNDGEATPEIFTAFTDEAHKAGKGVFMRCVGPLTFGKSCALTGTGVMLHTGQIGNEINKDPVKWKDYIGTPPDNYCDMDPVKAKDMIAFLVEKQTAVEPNFVATGRGFPSNWKRLQQEDRDIFNDPNLSYYPEFAKADLWDNAKSPEEYLTPDEIALRACGYKNQAKFVGDLVAAGGRALVSSDDTQSAPGLGVHQEMAAFQEDAHIAPMKIIQGATKWSAEGFGIKDIGSVEVGKLADLVIVDADPTKDIFNMRKINTVIKDGQIVDREYHPWYQGHMFSNDLTTYDNEYVSSLDWVAALKTRGSLGLPPKPLFVTTGPNGKPVTIGTGPAAARRGPGLGPVPDYSLSPTPGIETIMPHTVIQGTADTVVTLTGINFVVRSVVYINDAPVPTTVQSGTKLTFVLDKNLLAKAGKLHITVKNPAPLWSPKWGDTSNTAHILVPFSFTTKWSQNKF